MKCYTWGGVTLEVATDQQIVAARFTGALVPEAARVSAESFAAELVNGRAVAGLVDYRGAGTAITLSKLSRELAHVAHRARTMAIPTALVVRRDELAAWRAHARRMCGAGLMRAAFDDPHHAQRWAAEMAALYAAQASYRSGRG